MSRQGTQPHLLDGLHARGCDGREFSSCKPVVTPGTSDPNSTDGRIEVVYMMWCEECGAAAWEVV